jgi:hypothetical protein
MAISPRPKSGPLPLQLPIQRKRPGITSIYIVRFELRTNLIKLTPTRLRQILESEDLEHPIG